MSDSKEFNEANEKELEQVAGGAMDTSKIHYRCPVCGKEKWEDISPSPVRIDPVCPVCLKNGQEVEMKEIR